MVTLAMALLFASSTVAGIAYADKGGGGHQTTTTTTVPGSPGDNCSHGNSNKPCKDDPQPGKGKDCDDHGKARGNEDHCKNTTTTPTTTETTPTTTTTTTTTAVTPPTTTAVTPTTTPTSTSTSTTTASTPVTTTSETTSTTETTTTPGTPTPKELKKELKQQEKKPGTGRVDNSTPTAGQLPHTGVSLWFFALAGVLLIGIGTYLVRITR